MEALSLRPKFLDCISSEVYQEKDNWKIDDIALGPANELLICGHNPVIHKIFISMYKEDSGKYGNRPELNKNFDQTQPGEQLALFLGGSPMIGLKVENALQILTIKDMCVYKTIKLRRLPTSVCFYKGTLYAASSSSNIVSACSLDAEDETNIVLSNMKSDCVLKIVVLMEKIYVCTKYDGRALVFSMTGSKKMEFANAIQTDAMATSICIHERTEFVFVLWNNIQIQIYSQKTSRFLFALNMSEQLHKLCVTPENILVTSSGSKCKVTFYDVGEAIKFVEFENTLLSSVNKKHRKKLMSNDGEMQSKVENLRDMTELYIQLLKENDNLRIKYERDIQKLNLDIERSNKEKDDVTEKLEKTKSNLSSKEADLSDVQAKLDAARTESDDLRRTNEEKEEKRCSLTRQIEAERKTTEELEYIIDRTKKEKDDVAEELVNTKSNLCSKEADLSDVQEKLVAARTESDNLRRTNAEKEEKCCSLTKQLEAEKKTTEEGGITKDVFADSIDYMKTGLKALIDEINDNTVELMKQKDDVTRELENTKSTLKKKEVDRSQIQDEHDAAISKKKELEKTATDTDKLNQIIEAKEKEIQQLQMRLKKAQTEVENVKTQVTILQGRKQELQKSLSREHDQSEELNRLRSNAYASSFEYNKKFAQLEDAHSRLKIEYNKAEKTQTLLSDLNEEIKKLHGMNTELESQQEKLKHSLQQEKGNAFCETRARILAQIELENIKRERRRGLFDSKKEVKNNYTTNLRLYQAEKELENLQHEKKQLEKAKDSLLRQKQQIRNEIEEEKNKGEINKQVYTNLVAEMDTLKQTNEELKRCIRKQNKFLEEMRTLGKKRSFSEVTSARFLSDSLKFDTSQGHNSDPYWFDETGPAVNESMDSGVITSTTEMDDWSSGLFSGNYDQIRPEFKVAVTVSSKGTKMLIPETGVELYVPGGSLLSRQLIEINIIDFDNDKFDTLFSLNRNSSVAVQLLPNKAPLRCPARLRLPHCLRLKPNFQELKSHVRIYCSEHAPGQDAQWEHDPELRYELKEDCCIIFVKKFCCIRYDVIDEAIDATSVTVFTSGKQHGTSMELTVGYHLDLPGRREMLLTMKGDMKIFKAKPFEFVKESTDTLQVHLTTAVSRAQSYEKTITEVDGKLSVFEAAAKIAELPLDRPKPLHLSDASHIEGNQHISTAMMLKVAETVSNKGTTMRILDTGIELDIPPNAFKGYRYIEMSVIPFGTLDEPIHTFSSNSSVIVELLPNKATFSTPVRLSLPHCLKLKKGCSKDSVKIYLSHHEKDQKPFWEELPDAKYELKADHCVIYLTSFCWVKYEIDNKIVIAKRIKVYTATRGMEQNDQIAEVEVGYFLDMPGRAENLRENVDLKISQCKPLLFFKDGSHPLEILLIKVLPMVWKYSTPERNPKVIPYKSIADSVDTSLPFVFENQDANEKKPFVMFKVSQGNEEAEINIRL